MIAGGACLTDVLEHLCRATNPRLRSSTTSSDVMGACQPGPERGETRPPRTGRAVFHTADRHIDVSFLELCYIFRLNRTGPLYFIRKASFVACVLNLLSPPVQKSSRGAKLEKLIQNALVNRLQPTGETSRRTGLSVCRDQFLDVTLSTEHSLVSFGSGVTIFQPRISLSVEQSLWNERDCSTPSCVRYPESPQANWPALRAPLSDAFGSATRFAFKERDSFA
jgi:hypothetical protein